MDEVAFASNPECLFSNTPQMTWAPRMSALVERCEGTGRPSNFTLATFSETTGSSNWDYTTSPAPLSEVQSLYMQSDGQRFEYAIFGATSPCYVYWKCHILQWNTANHTIMHFDDEDINGLLIIRKNTSTGHARVTDLTDSSDYDSTYDLNADTTYYFWLDVSAAGVVSLYINTTATKPASPEISFTMGTVTSLGMIALSVEYSGQNIYDDMFVSGLPITGDPFVASSLFTQAIAGSMPASAGTLVRSVGKATVGSLVIGAGVNTKYTTKRYAGSLSLATGNTAKRSTRSLSGAMPAQAGVIVKRAGKSLAGSIPFQSGTIIRGTKKSLAGSMPVQGGIIVKDTVRILSGSLPASIGATAKKTYKTAQGTIPGSSGSLYRTTSKAFSGSFSSPVGSIVKRTLKSLSGSLPYPEGDPGIGTMFNEAVAGIVPAITGGIAKAVGKGLAGIFPPFSGAITRRTGKGTSGTLPSAASVIKKDIAKIVAGQVPSQGGSVSSDSAFLQNESGSIPTPTGGISKRTGKGLTGNSPSQTGSVNKKTSTSKSGSVPSPSGNPGPTYHTSEETSGVMGIISGIVNGIIVVVDFTRRAAGIIGSRLRKIIGG